MSRVAVETLARTVEELQAQVAELSAKLARLETPSAPKPQAEPAPVPQPPPVEVEEQIISEEILLAISAAVAAYLGERAHVRAVRLISTSRWSQEGRVSIQASHRLERGL